MVNSGRISEGLSKSIEVRMHEDAFRISFLLLGCVLKDIEPKSACKKMYP